MSIYVDLHYHCNGKWVTSPEVKYVGGDVVIQQKCDIDLFHVLDLQEKMISLVSPKIVKELFILEEGDSMHKGLRSVVTDSDIVDMNCRIIINKTKVIHLYATTMYDGEVTDNRSPFSFREKSGRSFSCVNAEFVSLSTRGKEIVRKRKQDFGGSSNELSKNFVAEFVNHVDPVRLPIGICDEQEEEADVHEDDMMDDDPYSGDESSGTDTDEDDNTEIEKLTHVADVQKIQKILQNKYVSSTHKNHFFQEMTFKDANEVRIVVDRYAIFNGVNLELVKSDPKRMRYKCVGNCPFMFYVVKDGDNPGLQLRSYNGEHTCAHAFVNKRMSCRFLVDYFREEIQDNPAMKCSDVQKHIKKKLLSEVSHCMCKRAKRQIRDEIFGSYKDEYNKLEAYCDELRASDPGSCVSLEISGDALREGRREFKRLFICLNSIKQGWKAGCRPIIGLDGCFLKTKAKGQLLVATGIDACDQFYPIFWALVDRETKFNWEWFLRLLQDVLELGEGDNYTAMSDMQKGLLPAIKNVLPNMEHRFCARHVHANWSKLHKGQELHKWFWITSWSSYEEQFRDNLKTVGKLKTQAAKDLLKYPPRTWVRCYFSARCKSNKVDNNFTKSFNAWVLGARYKPVLSLLEEIRLKCMNKIVQEGNKSKCWTTNWAPKAYKECQINKATSMGCRVDYNGDNGYEVTSGNDKHVVKINERRCSCRSWDLTGIPCPHACVALLYQEIDPDDYISHWYSKETYNATYQFKVQPLRGQQFWKLDAYEPLEPPPIKEEVGRPKLKRKLEVSELLQKQKMKPPAKDPNIYMSRRGQKQRCKKCGKTGHNSRTCSNEKTVGINNDQEAQIEMENLNVQIEDFFAEMLFDQEVPHVPPIVVTQQSQSTLQNARKDITIISHETELQDDEDDNEEDTDPPGKRLPILDEINFRLETCRSMPAPTGTREISMKGNGLEVPDPSDLPFEEPGLMWRGQRSITGRQPFQMKADMEKKKKAYKG